jgi:outer membrane protein TolC
MGVPLGAALPDLPFAESLFPELRPYLEAVVEQGEGATLGGLTVEERSGDADVARSQRGPSVRFFGRFTGSYEMREDIDNVTRADVASNLTVTQPLYRWGNLKRQVEIADKQVDLAELNQERSVTRDLYEARQAYLYLLLNRERVAVLQQSIRLSQGFVDTRKKLADTGQFSEQDVLEMEARLLENQERLAWAQKRLLDQQQALERLTGRPVDVDTLSESLDVISPLAEADWMRLRAAIGREVEVSGGFDTRQWEMMESIEDERLAILDKRNWPEFDLVAGAYSDRLDAVYAQDSIFRLRSFAGLQVSWNIFDNWQTQGYARSALARKRAYAERKAQSTEADERRLTALLADIDLNRAQIEARGKREVLLTRRLELLREYVQDGRITGSELLEGEIDYLDVRQRLMEARVTYLLNLMQIALLVDTDPLLEALSPSVP